MPPSALHLKKLSHLCLGTRQLEKLIHFYCEVLGGKIIHEFINPKNERYGIFLSVNGGTFLEIFNDPTLPTENIPTPNRFRHFCFEVENIEHAATFFREKGYVVDVVRGKTDRVLQFWIEDPDSNKIEFHHYDKESIQYPYL